MPKSGDEFTVILKKAHLGWGTYRYTDTRDPIYGEGYIKIPLRDAKRFEIYNSNHPTANTRYQCTSVDGNYSGILLAQGSKNAGDVYAKQFAEEGNLKGIGSWYKSVGALEGGEVRVTFTSPNSLEIEYLG